MLREICSMLDRAGHLRMNADDFENLEALAEEKEKWFLLHATQEGEKNLPQIDCWLCFMSQMTFERDNQRVTKIICISSVERKGKC